MRIDLSVKYMIAFFVLITGAAVAYWGRGALRVYRAEAEELTVAVPAPPLPTDLTGLDGIAEVSWKLGSRTQRAWHVPSRNGALIIYGHGSPGARDALLTEARALGLAGYGALLLDFPSFGGSEGERDWGASFVAATRAAIDFALEQPGVDPKRIGAFGYSMGSCVVAMTAANDPRLSALVLLSPFTRLDDQLRYQFQSRVPGLAELSVWTAEHHGVATTELDSERALRGYTRPVLIISGDSDHVIPRSMPERLAVVASSAELWIVPGAGHIDVPAKAGSSYTARLRDFFDRSLGAATALPTALQGQR